MKWGSRINQKWVWNEKRPGLYTVKSGYLQLLNVKERISWEKLVWSRANIPKKAFVSWPLLSNRLPVKHRLAKFGVKLTPECPVCNVGREDIDHLFFDCNYAQEVWQGISRWLQLNVELKILQGHSASCR